MTDYDGGYGAYGTATNGDSPHTGDADTARDKLAAAQDRLVEAIGLVIDALHADPDDSDDVRFGYVAVCREINNAGHAILIAREDLDHRLP
jgi:hypothetical protein